MKIILSSESFQAFSLLAANKELPGLTHLMANCLSALAKEFVVTRS
jgi:hypothetical protein